MIDHKQTPQVHHDLIIAWAKGAKIQLKDSNHPGQWKDVPFPGWNPYKKYRIKPEPKPDLVLYSNLYANEGASPHTYLSEREANAYRDGNCVGLLKYTISGETGKIISHEILPV